MKKSIQGALLAFSTLISIGAQANISGAYRISSASQVVSTNGVTRCVWFLEQNVFGSVGDVLFVSLDNAGLTITQTTTFGGGASLPIGHSVQEPTGCCGGDEMEYTGKLTAKGASFFINDISTPSSESVQLDATNPEAIVLLTSFGGQSPSTCRLDKVN